MSKSHSKKVHLDHRLKTVAEFVHLDKRIADIGTDHGYIPCYLYQQGAREIFACDILEKPLAAAKATMELYKIPEKKEGEGIGLILGDGLDNVPPVDDVIIAGMGGEMIADIVSRCSYVNKDMRFILQPMTRDWVLRRELYKNGLYIEEEKTAVVGNKVYTVMLCCYDGIKREIDDKFAFLGKNQDKIYRDKMIAILEKKGKGDIKYKELAENIKSDFGL